MYKEVIDLVNFLNTEFYANASSRHSAGLVSYEKIKTMKEQFCNLLHIKPESLVFTSGGAESNNFAVKSIAFANISRGGNIVITSYEHPSVTNTAKYLEKFGFEIRTCPLDKRGNLDIQALKYLVDENTILVSTAHVCSETGALTDIKVASDIIKSINPRCYYHIDAVQSFGKFNINLYDLNNIDLVSFSSHKIHGPKGVGAIYIKPKTIIDPFILGSKTSGLRAGTMNTSGVCGFCMAFSKISKKMDSDYLYVKSIRDHIVNSILTTFEDALIVSPEHSSPFILNVAFKNIKSEVLLNALSQRDIYVSSGSACTSKSNISPVLQAMNIPKEYIEGAIRISFCDLNTIEDADILISNLKELIPMLQLFVRR